MHPFWFTSLNDWTTYMDNANMPTYVIGAAVTAVLGRIAQVLHRRSAARHAATQAHIAALQRRHDEHAEQLGAVVDWVEKVAGRIDEVHTHLTSPQAARTATGRGRTPKGPQTSG